MSVRFLFLFLLGSLLGISPGSARIRISEFVASNQTGHRDREGKTEDWLELYNDGITEVNLAGWSLTDDEDNLRKWVFPDVTIPADGYLLVFASGNNRRIPGEELHTNFSLGRDGEYLALVRPNGVTLEDGFVPAYQGQFEDVSYGLGQTGQVTSTVIAQGAAGRAGVPSSAADFTAEFNGWNSDIGGSFGGSTWRAVSSGVGFDQDGSLGAWLGAGGDFESELFEKNGSVFLRLPFTVTDPEKVTRLTLRMRWDDGFLAYINGTLVAANREPAIPAWNSLATSGRLEGENDDWISFPIDLGEVSLEAGENLLAVQGLNEALDSPDLFVLPELDMTTGGVVEGGPVYHSTPTPGEANGTGATSLPPLLSEVTSEAEEPAGGAASEPLVITARVSRTSDDVSRVNLSYRVMFDREIRLAMKDDGIEPDEEAGDGVFTVAVPTTDLRRGEMIRWRVEAVDASNRTSSDPPFPVPNDSDRYYGTIARDATLDSSRLPVLHTFIESVSAVNTRSGTRGAIYYLGRFYDNIQMDLHGQSTAGPAFPKKSYDIDFNKGNRFLWREGERKVKDINLLTNYADKSKVRNTLGYEMLKRSGAAYHFAFPVRVQRNGAFYSVQDMVEDGDERYLDRLGLDENGALYKMYDRMENAGRASKKTRKHENTADLALLISRLDPTQSRDTRRRYAYDLLNIPGCVNYLAAYTVAGITDAGHKNYYMYRDTEDSGEWHPLPWDVDLSAGRRWTGSQHYFYDTLHNDYWNNSSINRLWDLIHNTPDYREMYLRRVSTLRDELLVARRVRPEVDWIVQMVRQLEDQIDPEGVRSDADLDFQKWGSWGNNFQTRAAAERILTEWLPQRRNFMFSSARNQGGVPVPARQPAVPRITIETIDFNPPGGNQEQEYFVLKNNETFAVDLSGWTVSGAVDFEFPPGTVIPAAVANPNNTNRYQGLLHVAKRSAAFRTRRSGPRSGQFRFIVGGYKGQLSARGETIELRSARGLPIAEQAYEGDPSQAQNHLRITEINYHPLSPTPGEEDAIPGVIAEDFEWIELLNIGAEDLDLEGVQFSNGIQFSFGATVLPAGERLILAKNPSAFALRHPGIEVPVLGPYSGYLDNDGEALQLVDAVGENIMNFDFNDRWYPSTDGVGKTLVLRDPDGDWKQFDQPGSWGSSNDEMGSAGVAGSGYQVHFNAWQSGHFSSAERDDPSVGTALGNPDGDPWPNWQEYAFGLDPRVADEALFESRVIAVGADAYLGAALRVQAFAPDLSWQLEVSDDGATWVAATQPVVTSELVDGDLQTVVIREADPAGAEASRLSRVRLNFAP